MELTDIEKLLHRYLKAETSLSEEKVLKTYFLSEKVSPHLKEYRRLFGYFEQSKADTFDKKIDLATPKNNKKWLFIAASVTLLVGLFFSGNQYYKQKQAEKQYNIVKGALQLVSVNLKKSKESIANLYTYQNTVNKIFKIK